MKKILEGDMPEDFWNYLVNPIVGYYIKGKDENSIETERKYGRTPQVLKQ